jgi:tRNA (guanine-N7-)-methyltransferase
MTRNIKSSGLVSSSQQGIHPQLEKTLCRHLENDWLQPFHQPTLDVYTLFKEKCGISSKQPFILDSGCGTGDSSRKLAGLFPDNLVIGVDQSQARLAKNGLENGFIHEKNLILLRAELSTFWRLMTRDDLEPSMHYLFYPNPWPKAAHMKRRWHGHPVFPVLLELGGEIEMRSNWEIYAQEFAFAVGLATGRPVIAKHYQSAGGEATAASPFEQKYLERGQALYSVSVPASVTALFRAMRRH